MLSEVERYLKEHPWCAIFIITQIWPAIILAAVQEYDDEEAEKKQ